MLEKNNNVTFFSPVKTSLPNHVTVFPEAQKNKLAHTYFSLKLRKSFEHIIKQYKLDIVHLQGGPGGIFLFKNLSVPVIYTSHHTYWQQYSYISSQRWKAIFYRFEKKGYTLAKKIICVSQDTKAVLKKQYDLTDTKLTYIPNGVTEHDIHPFITKTHKQILYVGRIDKRKGVEFLLKSMKIITSIDPTIKLAIVGEGKDREALEKFCGKHALSVKFYGFVPDEKLIDLYTNSSIQIVPSLFEGFGISVLEGMARGLPVIGTRVDGIKSIISHEKNGMLVEYGNEQELANAVLFLLNDPALQKQLVTNAFQELTNYKWNDIYHQTLSVYEQLTN